MRAMDGWVKLAEIANDVATTLAILVGGAWAYFKFLRGRTFASRAELEVAGSLFAYDRDQIIHAKVTLTNMGLSKLSLMPSGKVIYLYGIPASQWSPEGNVEWQKLVVSKVLEGHRWIEAQETVSDDALIPVPIRGYAPDENWLAFRLQAQVWGKRPKGRKRGTRWIASVTVPAGIKRSAFDELQPTNAPHYLPQLAWQKPKPGDEKAATNRT
jgi:hypothetical protein